MPCEQDWIVPDLKRMVLPPVPLAPPTCINMQTAFLQVSKEKQKVQINKDELFSPWKVGQ